LAIGVQIIIGMPLHIIIIGAPMAIIDCMASQRSFMRAIIEASVGIIFIIMPSFVISQDILHAIGIIIMPFIIIGIMPIMPFIIGMPIIPMPMPPFIIGIIMPFMPFMPFIIGMLFIGIMFMLFMGIEPIPFIIGIAVFMVSSMGKLARTVLPNGTGAKRSPCAG
jgi:hypothetical protein